MRSFGSITEKLLVSCGFHHGYLHDQWRPDMRPYISGFRSGFKVMDVQKAVLLFRNALRFLRLSLRLKRPGLAIQHLDIDYVLDNQKDFFSWSGISQSLYVVNHRFGGLLTNWSRTRKQYLRMVWPFFPIKLPKNLFPAFGIALTSPMPYSLIMEFNALSVPLVALVDSNTLGVEDVYFPVISSFISQKWAFYFFRAAVRIAKIGFKFERYLLFRFESLRVPMRLKKPFLSLGKKNIKNWRLSIKKWKYHLAWLRLRLVTPIKRRIFPMLAKYRKISRRRPVHVFKLGFVGSPKRLQKVFLLQRRLRPLLLKGLFVRRRLVKARLTLRRLFFSISKLKIFRRKKRKIRRGVRLKQKQRAVRKNKLLRKDLINGRITPKKKVV